MLLQEFILKLNEAVSQTAKIKLPDGVTSESILKKINQRLAKVHQDIGIEKVDNLFVKGKNANNEDVYLRLVKGVGDAYKPGNIISAKMFDTKYETASKKIIKEGIGGAFYLKNISDLDRKLKEISLANNLQLVVILKDTVKKKQN